MIVANPPKFVSDEQYRLYRADTVFWQPLIVDVLRRHKIDDTNTKIIAGFNSTYPVFVIGDLVIKFFGYRKNWHETFLNECEAHEYLAHDENILAPTIIARGHLFENVSAPWAYTITKRISGNSWLDSALTREQQINVVSQLGKQLKHIHALPANGKLKTDSDWVKLNIKAAAKQSVLPHHLIDQVESFLAKLDPFDKVLTHGDLVGMHVFIDKGGVSGIIDWGDATLTDRHYELGKLTDMFPCDKVLLRTFLDTANWPVTKNFARQSLGLALYRQAVGLTQHFTFDVFHKLPGVLPMSEVKNLDELADLLFKV